MFMKKRQLEMALQEIPSHSMPKIDLEQYSTPSVIASDVLWHAHSLGDLDGMKVADLGCGTGIFAIGAVLMGAVDVVGVDIDEDSISTADLQAFKMGISESATFLSCDIVDFEGSAEHSYTESTFWCSKI